MLTVAGQGGAAEKPGLRAAGPVQVPSLGQGQDPSVVLHFATNPP